MGFGVFIIFTVLLLNGEISAHQAVIQNGAEIVRNELVLQGPGTDTCKTPKLTGTDLSGCSTGEKYVTCKCDKCESNTGARVQLVCKNSKWYPYSYSQGSNVLCIDNFENDEIVCTSNDCRCKTNCKTFQLTCDTKSIQSKINTNCKQKQDYEQTYFIKAPNLSAKFYVNGTVEFFCNNNHQLEGEKYRYCTDARAKQPNCTSKTNKTSTKSTYGKHIKTTQNKRTTESTKNPSTLTTASQKGTLLSSTKKVTTESLGPITTDTTTFTTVSSSNQTTSRSDDGLSLTNWIQTGSVILATLLLILGIILCLCIKKRRKKNSVLIEEGEYEMNDMYMTQSELQNNSTTTPNDNRHSDPAYDYIATPTIGDNSAIASTNRQSDPAYDYIAPPTIGNNSTIPSTSRQSDPGYEYIDISKVSINKNTTDEVLYACVDITKKSNKIEPVNATKSIKNKAKKQGNDAIADGANSNEPQYACITNYEKNNEVESNTILDSKLEDSETIENDMYGVVTQSF